MKYTLHIPRSLQVYICTCDIVIPCASLLELQDCHISGQGAGELADALYKNSTLQILDLNLNPIGMEGASSMSGMLQHNTSLVWLYMCDNSVGEEGVHQLMNSVKHNQALTKLTLPQKYKSETSDLRVHWWWWNMNSAISWQYYYTTNFIYWC